MKKGPRFQPLPKEALIFRQIYRYYPSQLPSKQKSFSQPSLQAQEQGYSQLLAPVEELFFGGGGGAGRALPSAIREASKYGLDLNKIKVVCGSSVGTILALGLTIGIPLDHMPNVLDEMPTEQFTDWSFDSVTSFPSSWGLCKGEVMPNYFKKLIKERTGLEDPTFQELYDAGYTKELRVVTSNLDTGDITVFSRFTTPDKKICPIMALSCFVPIIFPPRWIENGQGEKELHTDGGVLKNYPFGVGSDDKVPLNKQLGFIFVNGTTAKNLEGEQKPKIKTLLDYFVALASVLIFQQIFNLEEPVKQRTIAVRINHNSLKFTATQEEQKILDRAGAESVKSFVHQAMMRQKASYQGALVQAYRTGTKADAKDRRPERQKSKVRRSS